MTGRYAVIVIGTLVHKRKSYSAHIDPPELLVYRKLIMQVHTARGSIWSHSLAVIAARGISIT